MKRTIRRIAGGSVSRLSEPLFRLSEPIRSRYVARLSVALLAAVLLLLVAGLVVQGQTANQVRADAREDLRIAAESQSSELSTWMAGYRRDARTLSDHSVYRTDDVGAIKGKLISTFQSQKVGDDVVAIHYLNTTSGRIVTSTSEEFVGVRPADQGAPFVSKLEAGFAYPGEVHVSDPFTIDLVNHPVVAVISPVSGTGDRVIVLMVDPTKEATAITQFTEGGHTHLVTADGDAVATPGNATHAGGATNRAISRAMDGDTGVVTLESGDLMGYARVEGQDWVVLTHVPRADAFALTSTVRFGIGGMLVIALVALGLIGATIGRSTAVALRSLAADAERLGSGTLDVRFGIDRGDELGRLADSLSDMRDSLQAKISDVEEARERADRRRRETEALNDHLEAKAGEYDAALAAVADGDLRRRVDPASRNEAMASIGESINEAVSALEATVAQVTEFASAVATASTQVDSSAEEVRRASEDASEAVQEISDGASRQTGMLSEVSSEMQNLSATAQQAASATDDLAATSEQAAAAGEQGRAAAQTAIAEMNEVEAKTEQAVDRIEALDEEMDEIDEVVELISQVAEQTNILALNASIEASRAGEAGEGFAVVAEEVKTLAEEAKDAAEDIGARIERIQAHTGDTVSDIQETRERLAVGVETVEEAIDSLEAIAEHVETTDAGVQEISDATAEQARAAQSVASMIDDLSSISEETTNQAQTVAAAAEEQAATLTEVSDSASHLSARASELRSVLETFDVGDSHVDDPDRTPPAED